MLPSAEEGQLRFEFPHGWHVTKYDDWAYYRNRFQSFCGSSKAVDFLVLENDNTLWLVEVKDYRAQHREKVIGLADEIALKVRDTLAGLAAARVQGYDAEERNFARRACRAAALRVALHLEQTHKPSKLFPRVADPSNILLKLKQKLRPVDAHPVLCDMASAQQRVPWTVEPK